MEDVFPEDHKRLIVGRSRTILERAENLDELEELDRPDTRVQELTDEWAERYPNNEAFQQRLRMAGLNEESLRTLIQAEKLAEDCPLPMWIQRLESLVSDVQSLSRQSVPGDKYGQVSEDETVPFGHLIDAISEQVSQRVFDACAEQALSMDAKETIINWFARRFRSRYTRIFFVEFKAFAATRGQQLSEQNDEHSDPDDTTDVYDAFIDYLFSGGFASICEEYPMFARLLTTQIRQLEEFITEFSSRFNADTDQLAAFGTSTDGPLKIKDVEILAEDTHGDGRAIMRVDFMGGHSVVYKPRSVEAGKRFYDLLERLDQELPVPEHKKPQYLVKEGYGWMEYVEPTECKTAAGVSRYYQRAGSLLCLAYLFEFKDCQIENLLVAGEYPVLVDAETVFHAYIRPERYAEGSIATTHLFNESCLLTHLLPFSSVGRSEQSQNDLTQHIAGIAASGDDVRLDELSHPEIINRNTNDMAVTQTPATLRRAENIPRFGDNQFSPQKHLSDLLFGFRATYLSILNLRNQNRLSDVLTFDEAFSSVKNRIVYRPTMRYMEIINSLCSRACLHDGARFGIEIEELAAPFFSESFTPDPLMGIFRQERVALRLLDPPRFTASTSGTEILWDDDYTGVSASRSGLQRAKERINAMDEDDMEEQVELIRASFGVPPTEPPKYDVNLEITTDYTDEQLIAEAEDICQQIQHTSIEPRSGDYRWATLPRWAETHRLVLRAVDDTLHNGRCGISVFAAGLYQVTGDQKYKRFSLDVLRQILTGLSNGTPSPTLTQHGGTQGIGGVAYAIGIVSELLDERRILSYTEPLCQVASEVPPAMDDSFDVVRGSAGTILGLLALYERNPDTRLVEIASQCGQRLLNTQQPSEKGGAAWPTLGTHQQLTGFGHGASGIAHSLLRLYDMTGETQYRDSAIKAVRFEQAAYSDTEECWPDYRRNSEANFLDRWCHGRTGIGLSRLAMRDIVDSEIVEEGVKRAIHNSKSFSPASTDHLCCGTTGRAMLALEAQQRLDVGHGLARQLLTNMVSRKSHRGTYAVPSKTARIPKPSLFDGIAGIGYGLLRVASPDELPCVLLFE